MRKKANKKSALCRHSTDQLRCFAEEHLLYELQMLVTSAVFDPSQHPPGWERDWAKNARLETFALHFRALVEFFWKDANKPGAVRAAHYVDSPEPWKPSTPKPDKAAMRSDKEVAHLTIDRLSVKPSEKGWDVPALANTIVLALDELLVAASHERLGDLVARLEALEDAFAALRHAVVERASAATDLPPQTGALAFFPWMSVPRRIDVGGYTLLPWSRDDPRPAWTAELLRPYVDHVGRPVERATLVELDGDLTGRWDETTRNRLFTLRDLLAFAGLARRTFFDQVAPYVNAHNFEASVQLFDRSRGGGSARVTRRRDGSETVFTPQELHRVVCPTHVRVGTSLDLDYSIVEALVGGWLSDSTSEWLMEAVALFNLANTDATEMREHVEVLLIVASIQAALGLGGRHREDELRTEFVRTLEAGVPEAKKLDDSPRANKTGSPPSDITLRGVWFKDLYDTRGQLAHGRTAPTRAMRWTVQEHLLLAAHLVPLLILTRLAREGHYALTDADREALVGFDHLLCMDDCFASHEPYPSYQVFRWPEVLLDARRACWNERAIAIALGEIEEQ